MNLETLAYTCTAVPYDLDYFGTFDAVVCRPDLPAVIVGTEQNKKNNNTKSGAVVLVSF
jgi:hypothetical protein